MRTPSSPFKAWTLALAATGLTLTLAHGQGPAVELLGGTVRVDGTGTATNPVGFFPPRTAFANSPGFVTGVYSVDTGAGLGAASPTQGGGRSDLTIGTTAVGPRGLRINILGEARQLGPGYSMVSAGAHTYSFVVDDNNVTESLIVRVHEPVRLTTTFASSLQIGAANPTPLTSSQTGAVYVSLGGAPGTQLLTPGDYRLRFRTQSFPTNQASFETQTVLMDWAGTFEPTNSRQRDALDYDADGKADLFVRNQRTGSILIHSRRANAGINGFETLGEASLAFDAAAGGDFNGDGAIDLLWHNPTNGNMWIWYTQGPGNDVAYAQVPFTIDPALRVVGTGDFNADGVVDICFHDPAQGDVYAWLMQHDSGTGQPIVAGVVWIARFPTSYSLVSVADFNADSLPDFVLREEVSDDLAQYLSLMGAFDGTKVAPGGTISWLGLATVNAQVVGSGDYNDDGNRDLLFKLNENLTLAAWHLTPTNMNLNLMYTGWNTVDLGLTGSDWRVRN